MDEFHQLLGEIRQPGRTRLPPTFLSFATIGELDRYLRRNRIPRSKWGRGLAKDIPTLFTQIGKENEARLFEDSIAEVGPTEVLRYNRVATLRAVHTVPRGETRYDTSPYVLHEDTLAFQDNGPDEPRSLSGRLILKQWRQEYGAGPFRPAKFPYHASETMKFHERDPREVVIRLATEEYGFVPSEEEVQSIVSWYPLAIGAMRLAADVKEPGASARHKSYDPGIPLEPGFIREGPDPSTKFPGTKGIKDIAPYIMEITDHFDPNGYIEVDDKKVTVFKWVKAAEA